MTDPSTTNAQANRMMGGLRKPDPGHMPTLFTLIIAWEFLTMMAFVLAPYLLLRHTDSSWTDPGTIAVISLACAVSTTHGAMAFIMGDRKGRSTSCFLWGALLLPLGLLVVWSATKDLPDAPAPAPGPLVRKLDRLFFKMGNIWFGISQLLAILASIMPATLYESTVGASIGNEAAYARFFNAPWFGALCVLFFITLYCATMRKYPFRISQIGWLTVHSGLLLLLVGCMTMFWGTYSGRMQLLEGQTSSTSFSSQHRELQLESRSLGLKKSFLVGVDQDPNRSDVLQEIEYETSASNGEILNLDFVIDRYYSNAHQVKKLVRSNDPKAQRLRQAGVALKFSGPASGRQILLERENPYHELGPLTILIRRITSERYLQGFSHQYAEGDAQRGALVIRDENGSELHRMAITPGERGDSPEQGATLDTEFMLKGRNTTIRALRYFSFWSQNSQSGVFDAAPGQPVMPGIEFVVTGKDMAPEKYVALASGEWSRWPPGPDSSLYNLEFDYDCIPELRFPNTMTVGLGPDTSRWIISCDSRGETTVQPLEIGRAYHPAPRAPFAITVESVVEENAAIEDDWVQDPDRQDGARVVRVKASDGEHWDQHWLIMFAQRSTVFTLGDRRLELSYNPRTLDLGFSISLLDFRQFNYPNSTKPMKYESNIVLRDREEDLAEGVLVDMNHPLSHRGYRFFNSSPIIREDMQRRGVVFQVARNPGRGIIYTGAAIVALGLVLVFFFKPNLRRWEQRRRTGEQVQIPAAAQPLVEGA